MFHQPYVNSDILPPQLLTVFSSTLTLTKSHNLNVTAPTKNQSRATKELPLPTHPSINWIHSSSSLALPQHCHACSQLHTELSLSHDNQQWLCQLDLQSSWLPSLRGHSYSFKHMHSWLNGFTGTLDTAHADQQESTLCNYLACSSNTTISSQHSTHSCSTSAISLSRKQPTSSPPCSPPWSPSTQSHQL